MILLLLSLLACKDDAVDSAAPVDADGDGVTEDLDCDDGDASVYPGAEERCDGLDQDCDDSVDESPNDPVTYYVDSDGDGYGDPNNTAEACAPGDGLVEDNTDCDDLDATTHPGAQEVCSEKDDDCDGLVDDLDDSIDWSDIAEAYLDEDGDGYGVGDPILACELPNGYTGADGDCDDEDASINPGAEEVCNGVDDDCDGEVDVNAVDGFDIFDDADGDGYGDDSTLTVGCELPSGTSATGGDCDDSDAWVYPGAPELCDGAFNDCDGASNWISDDGLVTHFDASGGYTDLSADFASGSSRGPASISISTDGTLNVCAGTYHVSLTVTATSLDIVGLDGSASTVLSGADAATVLTLQGSYATYGVEGLTLTEGYGCYGGGISCGRVSSCSSSGASFSFVRETAVSLYDVVVDGNSGPVAQGGVYAPYLGSFDMEMSRISNNDGTGLYVYQSDASCTGTSTTDDGIWGNSMGVYFYDLDSSLDQEFQSTSCDFDGRSSNGTDFYISDRDHGYASYSFGDDESFTCTTATSTCQ